MQTVTHWFSKCSCKFGINWPLIQLSELDYAVERAKKVAETVDLGEQALSARRIASIKEHEGSEIYWPVREPLLGLHHPESIGKCSERQEPLLCEHGGLEFGRCWSHQLWQQGRDSWGLYINYWKRNNNNPKRLTCNSITRFSRQRTRIARWKMQKSAENSFPRQYSFKPHNKLHKTVWDWGKNDEKPICPKLPKASASISG